MGGWVRLKMKFSNGRTHRIAEHLCPFLLFSNLCILSCVQLFPTLGTVAHQGPLSMGFSRQEHWSGLPFPSPRDLPDLGIKLMFLVSSALQEAIFFFFFNTSATWEDLAICSFPKGNVRSQQLVALGGHFNSLTKATAPCAVAG